MNKEIAPRIVTTDYSHQYIEIPTAGFGFKKRWDWIKRIAIGGDIIYRVKEIQHIDLRTPEPRQRRILLTDE